MRLTNISYQSKIGLSNICGIFELGNKSKKIHEELAQHILNNNIKELYTIGKNMKHLNVKLNKNNINKQHFNSSESLKKFILQDGFEEAVVLIKGSRGMKMEEYVKLFTNRLN